MEFANPRFPLSDESALTTVSLDINRAVNLVTDLFRLVNLALSAQLCLCHSSTQILCKPSGVLDFLKRIELLLKPCLFRMMSTD